MKLNSHWIMLLLVTAVACSVDESSLNREIPQEEIFGIGQPEENLLKKMNILVTEPMAASFETVTDEEGYVDISKLRDFSGKGIVRMKRLFPYAGEFEERTREGGLHLWYVIEYDESVSMTKASDGLILPGVVEIEYCPKIRIIDDVKPLIVEAPSVKSGGSGVFDDPMLEKQWHYYNTGQVSSSVSGCDINVLPVWRNYSTYSKFKGDIIVGVVDGGIDYSHEDLKDNMWKNPDKTGTNVYGYNFASSSFIIHPEDHGTHVAGTVAAVNNNGIGVCGVAGGDGKRGIKGAKLMSCQIFDGKKQGNGAEAIKWSADHGAVISQNSWGYIGLHETPSSLKAAVDYFIKNAGCDSRGNQRSDSPMKGGIVIFAAGNDNCDYSGNSYDKILNVSSLGADYKRAYYTCFGSWCDVSAPGGDAKKGNQVISTLPGNRYGGMQGTSMACPHVSGVAALLLLKYGGQGYTAAALRSRIEDNVTNISAQNPSYDLGKGLVNTYRAMAGTGGKAPYAPTNLSATTKSNTVSFNVTVPRDSDDGVPHSIYIYYSTSQFTSPANAMFGVFYVENSKPGDVISGKVSGLDFETDYYLSAVAVDLAGNKSAMTSLVKVRTGRNSNPILNLKSDDTFILKPHEKAVVSYDIDEPDGHFVSIELDPGSPAAVLDTLVRDNPKIQITAVDANTGKYTATLTVTDIYGASTKAFVKYEILENHSPYIVKHLEDILFTSKVEPSREFNVGEYFKDDDGEVLSYSFEFSNPTIANMTYSDGLFLLTPMNYGDTDVCIKGTDVRGESVTDNFRVLVADKNKPVVLYPNPVKSYLNVRLGKTISSVFVKIVSASGSVFFEDTFQSVSPFEPLRIDMSKAYPGVYTVVVEMDGSVVVKTNIAKV